MKFQYIGVQAIKGIVLRPEDDGKELVADPSCDLHAILTLNPDDRLFNADRGLAVASLMLRALFHAEPGSGELNQRIASEVESLRASRRERFKNCVFLVVTGSGNTEPFNPTNLNDAGDFVVCTDGADKSAISREFEPKVTAVVNAIAVEKEHIFSIRKVKSSIVFFGDDGRPIYSYALTAGGARGYISSPYSEEQIQTVNRLYSHFSADRELRRVLRLIRSSFETEGDLFRSFVAAWSAFEIFVNKVFRSTYEQRFMRGVVPATARPQFAKHIQDVMNGRYPLTVKFAIIACELSPSTADEDVEIAKRGKSLRNDLFHGEAVDESILPVEPIRNLAMKYLRLHFDH